MTSAIPLLLDKLIVADQIVSWRKRAIPRDMNWAGCRSSAAVRPCSRRLRSRRGVHDFVGASANYREGSSTSHAQNVGVTVETFVDQSRSTPAHDGESGLPSRTLVTSIWYPAAGPADGVAEGKRRAGHREWTVPVDRLLAWPRNPAARLQIVVQHLGCGGLRRRRSEVPFDQFRDAGRG